MLWQATFSRCGVDGSRLLVLDEVVLARCAISGLDIIWCGARRRCQQWECLTACTAKSFPLCVRSEISGADIQRLVLPGAPPPDCHLHPHNAVTMHDNSFQIRTYRESTKEDAA
eukprot:2305179-Rhodomonas_salina.1